MSAVTGAVLSQVAELPAFFVPTVDNPRADFSDTPWWLSLIKALLIFVYLLISTLLVIWFERRVIGRMQQRPGPNRVGPFGLLQPIADLIKLIRKESFFPAAASNLPYIIAPVVSAFTALAAFSVIPFGPGWNRFHEGIDIAADEGDPIGASLAGRVVFAGWNDGFGQLVTIAHHHGVVTMYAHLSRIEVQVGQHMAAGEEIGLVGHTGDATGPHLHFEVRLRGASVNPLTGLKTSA